MSIKTYYRRPDGTVVAMLTAEQSLAEWKCCSSMEEHLEHLAHLKRMQDQAQAARAQTWAAIEDLLEKIRTEALR